MEKIKSLVPVVAFCLLFVKGLVLNFSLFEVIALLILAAVFLLSQLQLDNKKFKDLQEDLDKTKKQVEDLNKKQEELKSYISGVKMAQNMRPGANR